MKPSHRMLTGEISWSLVALAFVWSAGGGWPFRESYLHRALEQRGATWVWCLVIGIPALVLLWASVREYWMCAYPPKELLRRWSLLDLDRSVRFRAWCCLAMSASWAYMLYVMIDVAVAKAAARAVFEGVRADAILPIAFCGCACTLWFWWENRRVQRDVRKATGTYPAHLAR